MKKINEIKRLASEANLTIRPITGAYNGYPEPETGIAVLGFMTFTDAIAFADAHQGTVSRLEWKGGWQFCNYKGEAFNALTIEEQVWKHTNRGVDGESVVHSVADFWENEVISKIEQLTYQDFDLDELKDEAIRDIISSGQKSARKIDSIIRSGGVAVISTHDLCVIEEIYPTMRYIDDTTRIEIGVTFDYSEE